jgi:4-hydroxybenzoate polyprenyltransferase
MSHETPAVREGGNRTAWYSSATRTALNGARRVRDAAVYSSAYFAVIAAVEVALVGAVLSLSGVAAPAAVVGLTAFAVYAVDRVADADTDAAAAPAQAAFARRHGDALYVAASLAYALAVSLALLGGPAALAVTLMPGAFWLVYAADWLPKGGFRRLKEVFLLNSGVVAFAWAATLVFLPLSYAGRAATPAAAVVFCYFFLRVFSNTEIPNVRDAAADREIGVRTLPVVLGVARTRRALYGIDALTAALVVGGVLAGYVAAVLAVPLLVGVAYSFAVVSRVGRTGKERRLAKLAECEYLVSGLALAAVVLA